MSFSFYVRGIVVVVGGGGGCIASLLQRVCLEQRATFAVLSGFRLHEKVGSTQAREFVVGISNHPYSCARNAMRTSNNLALSTPCVVIVAIFGI